MTQARFDKLGRRLPDTGHGCGCQLCAEANAPRYERRARPRGGAGLQSSDALHALRRRLNALVVNALRLRNRRRSQAAT